MVDNSEKIDLALSLLEKFNRKERYHLLRDAVVGKPFSMKKDFLIKVNEKLDFAIPNNEEDVYVAMDYHLDWIASAIHLIDEYYMAAESLCRYGHDEPLTAKPNNFCGKDGNANKGSKNNQIVTGNQADVDLLIAYKSNDKLILVMVEAKLESGWDGTQLRKKGYRLQEIFNNRRNRDWVVPRMILAGPMADRKAPNFSRNTLDYCPDWFFDPDTPKGKRKNKQLRRINLVAQHTLYQPARDSKEGENWLIKKTWPGNFPK